MGAKRPEIYEKVKYYIVYLHKREDFYSWDITNLAEKLKVKEGVIEHCLHFMNLEGLISTKIISWFHNSCSSYRRKTQKAITLTKMDSEQIG